MARKAIPQIETYLPLRASLDNFFRARWWMVLAVSGALLVPCFWHRRIEAGDLASHTYNAWLTQLIQQDKASGLHLAPQWNNVLFDVMLVSAANRIGLPAAEKLVVSICVLIFFWGSFALIAAASRRPPWLLAPAIAMIAYGWTFHAGFFNYYLSLGLAFFAIAIFWRGKGWELLASLALVPLIYLAHPLGVVWLVAAVAYIKLSEALPSRTRLVLPPAAIAALLATRYILHNRYPVLWNREPFYYFNGADQLWIFGPRYAVLAIVTFAIGATIFIADALHRPAGRWSAFRVPLELWAIAFLAAAMVPNGVFLARYPWPFLLIIQRLTSITAVLGLCALACIEPKRWHLAAFASLAAVFFAFLYSDTAALNLMEQQAEALVSTLPPGQRVLSTILPPDDFHSGFFSHMVDRACIGRCFSYGNYEPVSEQFRVRVRPDSPLQLDSPRKVCQIDSGIYVVQLFDLPLHQVYQPADNWRELRIRQLQPGEPNGRVGMRVAMPAGVDPCSIYSR